MMDKSLILIGAASFGPLLLAFGVVAGISSMNPKAEDTATGAPQQEVAKKSAGPSVILKQKALPLRSVDCRSSLQQLSSGHRYNPITAADLNNLSAMVNLKNPKLAVGDKTQWKVALSMAEKLLIKRGPVIAKKKIG